MSDTPYDIMTEFASLVTVFPNPPFLAPDLDDTALVIRATSLVDEFLKVTLVAGFRRDVVSRRRIDDVFTGHGPLATFSAKISLCALLGLTTPNVRHDLTILRKIRNDFAHSHEGMELRQFPGCSALKMTSKLEVTDACEARLKFKQSCLGIIGVLANATLIRTAQFRFTSKNHDGVMLEYSEMLKEADVSLPE
jgi:DNA-binding MltR family transcriptional regulator